MRRSVFQAPGVHLAALRRSNTVNYKVKSFQWPADGNTASNLACSQLIPRLSTLHAKNKERLLLHSQDAWVLLKNKKIMRIFKILMEKNI